jgi:hypothetical protein
MQYHIKFSMEKKYGIENDSPTFAFRNKVSEQRFEDPTITMGMTEDILHSTGEE